MTELKNLAFALNEFADLTVDDLKLSTSFWHTKKYKKGDFFNRKKIFVDI